MTRHAGQGREVQLGDRFFALPADLDRKMQRLINRNQVHKAIKFLHDQTPLTYEEAQAVVVRHDNFLIRGRMLTERESTVAYWQERLASNDGERLRDRLAALLGSTLQRASGQQALIIGIVCCVVMLVSWSTLGVYAARGAPNRQPRYMILDAVTGRLTVTDDNLESRIVGQQVFAQQMVRSDGDEAGQTYIGYLVRHTEEGEMEVSACYEDVAIQQWYKADSAQGRAVMNAASRRYGERRSQPAASVPVLVGGA